MGDVRWLSGAEASGAEASRSQPKPNRPNIMLRRLL